MNTDLFSRPFRRFLAATREQPILDPATEVELARRWRDHQDEAALSILVTSHVRLVEKMARQLRGYGLPHEDLVSEGLAGLVTAAHRFDTSAGHRFSTYAMWWVKAALYDHILRTLPAVRLPVTAARKKLFFKLNAMKAEVGASGQMTDDQAREVAGRLGVTATSVREMEGLMFTPARSLDAPVRDTGFSMGELMPSKDPSPEDALADRQVRRQQRKALDAALATLSDRERDIVLARTLPDRPLRLADLGTRYGLSGERIRQIEVGALRKLREFLGAGGPALVSG